MPTTRHPINAAKAYAPPTYRGEGEKKGSKMGRALLIEESASLRTSYSEYLTERGLDVYAAHGPDDALELLNAIRPEVTALDIDMRETDGFELIEEICKAGSLCLVISESGESQDRIRALAAGADDYVRKPIELEELFLRLRNMLDHRSAASGEPNSTVLDLNGVRVDLLTRALIGPDGPTDIELTANELTMLRILAENIDRVVDKESLFSAIRSETYSTATRSLDVGVSRLRIKLRSAGAPVEVRSVRQAGYLLSRIQTTRIRRS